MPKNHVAAKSPIAIFVVLAAACLTGSAIAEELTAPETTQSQAAAVPAAPIAASKRLDLRAPDITTIFSREQIEAVLRRTRDPDTIEEVEVERERDKALPPRSPPVPGGLIAPFWALLNPTQAWRIFSPIPDDQARYIGHRVPDATDPYRATKIPGF